MVTAAQASTLADILATLRSLKADIESGELSPRAADSAIEDLQAETRDEIRRMGIAAPGLPTSSSPNTAAAADVVARLNRWISALEDTLRSVPGSPFHLGRVEVNVAAQALPVPTSESLDVNEFRKRNARTLPDALNLLPGVSIQRIGPRNERGVYVRGFDARQVPLYIDGIPVYVPYDGYVDFDRFLVDDIAEIQVSKGFTSTLYGPNAIGGALNVVSREPSGPLDLDLGSGYATGNQVHGFANAGARWERFWLQGGFAWLSSDYVPLSNDFTPVPLQPDRERFNSDQRDGRARIQIAYTPNERGQYSFGYVEQQGEKGNPPYAGTDPLVRARFWQWPQWDKRSFYFIGNRQIGASSFLRARVFRDQFNNLLRSFDDATYTSQNRPFAFNSPYDDDTWGGTLIYGTQAGTRHSLKTSLFFKDDIHREGNIGEPERTFRDQSWSFGAEDSIRLTEHLSAIVGLSADYLTVRNAQDLQNGQVLPFPRNDVVTVNPMAGLFFGLGPNSRLHATWAIKTRLPTIKDRYSYRLGQAIPNPDLREERATHWEVGYRRLLGTRSSVEVNGFWSLLRNSTQRFFLQPNLFQFRNLGRGWNRGVEFSARTSPIESLQLSANYTYLSRVNRSDPSVILFDTPRHHSYASAVWAPVPRLSFLADLGWEAGRWTQNDAGRVGRAPQFASAGLAVFVQLMPSIELQTGARNLFDRNYFIVEGYPEAGRSVYVNVRYRLRR